MCNLMKFVCLEVVCLGLCVCYYARFNDICVFVCEGQICVLEGHCLRPLCVHDVKFNSDDNSDDNSDNGCNGDGDGVDTCDDNGDDNGDGDGDGDY